MGLELGVLELEGSSFGAESYHFVPTHPRRTIIPNELGRKEGINVPPSTPVLVASRWCRCAGVDGFCFSSASDRDWKGGTRVTKSVY
jgi:hypothetical protein